MGKIASRGTARQRQNKQRTRSAMILGGIVLVGIALLIVVWFALTPKGSSSTGTPQIQVSSERLELGKQVFGHPIRASFTVMNTGKGTLTLNVPRVATVLEGC